MRDHAPQLAMPMGQEPAADRQADHSQDQQLIADHQAGQDHERHTAEHEGRAGRHAADDHLERRINQRRQAEHEQPHAHPHNALEAGQLGSQLPGRVLLRRAQLRPGAGFLALDHRHRSAEDESWLRVEG